MYIIILFLGTLQHFLLTPQLVVELILHSLCFAYPVLGGEIIETLW